MSNDDGVPTDDAMVRVAVRIVMLCTTSGVGEVHVLCRTELKVGRERATQTTQTPCDYKRAVSCAQLMTTVQKRKTWVGHYGREDHAVTNAQFCGQSMTRV